MLYICPIFRPELSRRYLLEAVFVAAVNHNL
jgi:hypothetical protein